MVIFEPELFPFLKKFKNIAVGCARHKNLTLNVCIHLSGETKGSTLHCLVPELQEVFQLFCLKILTPRPKRMRRWLLRLDFCPNAPCDAYHCVVPGTFTDCNNSYICVYIHGWKPSTVIYFVLMTGTKPDFVKPLARFEPKVS